MLKGDANDTADLWQFQIDADAQPKVASRPSTTSGGPMIWLTNPTWRVLLIGVPAAVIFLLAAREVISVFRGPASARPEAETAQS